MYYSHFSVFVNKKITTYWILLCTLHNSQGFSSFRTQNYISYPKSFVFHRLFPFRKSAPLLPPSPRRPFFVKTYYAFLSFSALSCRHYPRIRIIGTPPAAPFHIIGDWCHSFNHIALCLQSVQKASGQLDRLEEAIALLDQMPERYCAYDRPKWRERILRIMPLDNYLVFFIPDHSSETVMVIRVIYGGRGIGRQLKKT